MADNVIFDGVVSVIAKHARSNNEPSKMSLTTDISKDLKVNSANFVDIVLDIEDRFKCQISDDDADKIKTIGDAVAVVERLLH